MTLGKKKGFAIIWTLITGSIMLLLATVMINATVKESKMVMNFAASTKVSNAAKSGITWANWCINNIGVCDYTPYEYTRTFAIDGIAVTVNIREQTVDGDTVYFVDSLGSDEKVVRKFNYRFAERKLTNVAKDEVGNDLAGPRSFFMLTPEHPNSFSLSYSFWVNRTNTNKTLTTYMHHRNIFNPSDLGNSIQVTYFNNFSRPYLALTYSGNPSSPKQIPLINPEDPTQTQYINTTVPFKVNITINYIKNVNITLTTRIASDDGNLPEISYRETISALGAIFGDINQVTFGGQKLSDEPLPQYNLGDVVKINMQQTTYMYITNIEHWGNP